MNYDELNETEAKLHLLPHYLYYPAVGLLMTTIPFEALARDESLLNIGIAYCHLEMQSYLVESVLNCYLQTLRYKRKTMGNLLLMSQFILVSEISIGNWRYSVRRCLGTVC